MGNFTVSLQQTCLMLLMIATGFILFRNGFITRSGMSVMGTLLLNLSLPATIVNSFANRNIGMGKGVVWGAFGVCALALALSFALSALLFRLDPIANFSCAFSNAGFMGIPLIQSVLGSEYVIFTAPFVAILNVAQWTYGVFILSGKKEEFQFRKLVRNPILIAFAIGVLILVTQITLPSVLKQGIASFAGMNAPLAMLILGAYLAQADLRSMIHDKRLYGISLVRLIVIPAVTLLPLKLMGASMGPVCLAVLICACAPVGSNIVIYAERCGKDVEYASKAVCVSTLFAVLTMPLMISLFGLL